MKKVMILAVVAAVLGISAPTFAQVPGSTQPSSTQEDEKDQTTQPSVPASGSEVEKSQGTTTKEGSHESMGSQYTTEVKSVDIPAAITRSLNEKYPGFKADKVYLGTDGTYKVKVSKGEDKQVLFFDARGEAVKLQK